MNFHKKTKSTKRVSSMCLSAHFGKGVSRFRGQQPTASHTRDYPAQQGCSVLNRRVVDGTRDSRTAKVSRTHGLKTIMAYTTELPRMSSTADAQFPTVGIVRGPLEYRTAL